MRAAVTAIALGALVIALAPPAYRNGGHVAGAAYRTLRDWTQRQADVATPGSGQQVHTPQVQAALRLLASHDAADFRLSEGVRADAFLHQRVEEAGWPRIFVANSTFLLRLESEASACTALGAQEGVALDRCQ